MKSGQRLTSSGHLEAANTAAKAGVKTLIATHFTPQMDALGIKEKCIAEMQQVLLQLLRQVVRRIVWDEYFRLLP